MTMSAKAILSSKGQLVIPKTFRNKMGLHVGSELVLELTSKNSLEIFPVTQSISKFFGMGKSKMKSETISVQDIDQAISQAVIESDRS
jgi:AbrB family looped-hinge helix DNA binding protein